VNTSVRFVALVPVDHCCEFVPETKARMHHVSLVSPANLNIYGVVVQVSGQRRCLQSLTQLLCNGWARVPKVFRRDDLRRWCRVFLHLYCFLNTICFSSNTYLWCLRREGSVLLFLIHPVQGYIYCMNKPNYWTLSLS